MIDINQLVDIHDNKETIHRHRRILEELFYLCINESFQVTVAEARETIQGMMADADVSLPVQNKGAAIELRNTHLFGNDAYQALLRSVAERHNYFHPSLVRNYWRVDADAATRNRFNILENILFFNNPIPDENPLEHFDNKSGYMEIAVDENGPYIGMHFDIGTTKQEIMNIIDKQFPETAELQEEQYKIPNTQYRTDSNLRLKAAIHEQSKLGRDDAGIAAALDTAGLVDGEYTGDRVRMQKQRMQKDTERFSPND